MLSFIPAGKLRSVAEYLVSAIVGALLLFIFFMASEAAVMLLKDTPLMSITFVPVICLLPLLGGALAAIVLEKLRKCQQGMKQGAIAGALAGLTGSFISSLILLVLSLLGKSPLGDALSSTLMVFAVLAISVGLDTLLGALGGALVAKFTADK